MLCLPLGYFTEFVPKGKKRAAVPVLLISMSNKLLYRYFHVSEKLTKREWLHAFMLYIYERCAFTVA
jgi:hypothetical protein